MANPFNSPMLQGALGTNLQQSPAYPVPLIRKDALQLCIQLVTTRERDIEHIIAQAKRFERYLATGE
jgi:hypothetical protein